MQSACETAGTKLQRVSPSVPLEQLAELPVPQMEDRQPQRERLVWKFQAVLTLSENSGLWISVCLLCAGTSVFQVTANDADDPTYGNSAVIVYTILDGKPYFSVDPKSGNT